MKEELEDFMEGRKKTYAAAAEDLWHGTIGQHVEQILADGERLTLDTLREVLGNTIANTKADTLVRLRAEKALEKLEAITPPHP